MKYFRFITMMLLAAMLIFSGCEGGADDNAPGGKKIYSEGDKETCTADSVSFSMVYVTGGKTFPSGPDDDRTGTVQNAYWIGETEVTYELWQKVYTWATSGSGATGAGQYTFANAGSRGAYLDYTTHRVYASGHETHPVTNASCNDFMVWCNALTEWYNAKKGTSYGCVYTTSSNAIIRDSRNSNAAACDGAVASTTAKGFRLPTGFEWELAARYRGSDTTNVVTGTINSVDFSTMTIKWTKGDSASGATTYYNDVTVHTTEPAGKLANNEVAVYKYFYNPPNNLACEANYADSTLAVKSKKANALGLYDMSGNVQEWCFDRTSDISFPNHMIRGGHWYDNAGSLRTGMYNYGATTDVYDNIGLRFARTAE